MLARLRLLPLAGRDHHHAAVAHAAFGNDVIGKIPDFGGVAAQRHSTPFYTGFYDAHSRVARRRSAFPTTLTEDSAIAAAAMIGDSSTPKVG